MSQVLSQKIKATNSLRLCNLITNDINCLAKSRKKKDFLHKKLKRNTIKKISIMRLTSELTVVITVDDKKISLMEPMLVLVHDDLVSHLCDPHTEALKSSHLTRNSRIYANIQYSGF